MLLFNGCFGSVSVISLLERLFFLEMGFLYSKRWKWKEAFWGRRGGVLCAKLKLHKIAPNAQGIRHDDVMISGEVQSLVLPLTLREVKQNHRHEVRIRPTSGS